jgi:hypothetical protein
MSAVAGWYHCSVKPVKRSTGRSAVAASAYRLGECLHDHRLGETYDYTRRSGVVTAFTVAPDHAPDWVHDPEALWNAAEAAENRINSQVAREYELSLPSSVSADEREGIARSFAQKLVAFILGILPKAPWVIVLELNSAWHKLSSLANSNAYFDLYGTGFAVHTGWVGPTTGILVNSADPTSISNLFGSSSTDGFTALQALVPGSSVIDAADYSGWNSLYIWQDANGNGVADPGEVESLSALGITSISLSTSPVSETVNGNLISKVATFTYSNGNTGQVAEAYFNNSQLDSTFTGSYTLNPETLLLPNLRGYGTTPDLYVAMSMDPTLLELVQNLANDSLSDAATFNQQVTNIIYRWTGVDGVSPTSRGSYVNAQQLDALEKVLGESFTSIWGGSNFPNPQNAHQGQTIETAWNSLLAMVQERLLAQGPLASLLSGVSYNYDTDSPTGTVNLAALVTAIGTSVPTGNTAAVQYLSTLGGFMHSLATDLGISPSTYDTALQGLFTTAGIPLTLTAIDNLHLLAPYYSGSIATFIPDAPGAVINGVSGFTNILQASDGLTGAAIDLTPDVVSNIQSLYTANSNGYITLRADELAGISTVTSLYGFGTINAATGGSYSLVGKTTNAFNMVATSTTGTTLTENNANGVTLQASASGNDTLVAGNGTGDILDADYHGSIHGTDTLTGGNGGDTFYLGGLDTATGGSGNDTFYIDADIQAGSSINGGGGTNTLRAGFDISGITITNVQILVSGWIYLNASELSSFTSLTAQDGSDRMYAQTAGTYSLAGKTVIGSYNMYANNNGGTTLIRE